jgi:osmoprotectant transport system permease protein
MNILIKILMIFYIFAGFSYSQTQIKVGSKKFTESVILGELAKGMIGTRYAEVSHIRELGGTRVLWNALLRGEIDIYPEYTGTLIQEILANEKITTASDLPGILIKFQIEMSQPLGFNNTYALGILPDLAEKRDINKISDLRIHPELRFGFTNEFMDRQDGWPGLQQQYQLSQKNVRGLDHDLAYRGIASGAIDVIDMYTTDAEIDYYQLKSLIDDHHYFPEYMAVFLYREDVKSNFPDLLEALFSLEGQISEQKMQNLNKKVKLEGFSESQVAIEFIQDQFNLAIDRQEVTLLSRLWGNTINHLLLVGISLLAAILISIPLGIIAFRYDNWGRVIMPVVGIIQTIPSLALLVFMIPLLGIGMKPAIMALFLYSLLPIVRNTHNGLSEISLPIRESAEALGLPEIARLRLIGLPLASRSILAGIKTSAVINVGTATLGALIGAGGYGQPILTGIRLDSIGLILEGAIPAALLALLVQWIFDFSEKIWVPKGLRLSAR